MGHAVAGRGGSWKGELVSYFVGVVCFVILPAIVTLFAPVSRLTLSSEGEGAKVSAQVTRYVYLVIPYRTDRLDEVTSVEATSRSGQRKDVYDSRSPNRRREVYVVGQGHLTLSGPGGDVTVSVTPKNIEDVLTQVNQFVASPNPDGISLFVYANLTISLIIGGLLSSLAALYVVGCVFAVLRWLLRLVTPT